MKYGWQSKNGHRRELSGRWAFLAWVAFLVVGWGLLILVAFTILCVGNLVWIPVKAMLEWVGF